jgi:hypothetical protein
LPWRYHRATTYALRLLSIDWGVLAMSPKKSTRGRKKASGRASSNGNSKRGKSKKGNSEIGRIRLDQYLTRVSGHVVGTVSTDAKIRTYKQTYEVSFDADHVLIAIKDSKSATVKLPREIALDSSLVAFFGLYSGDGSKGTEEPGNPGIILPVLSFSQKEKSLVRFAVDQFRRLFGDAVQFEFSLGEDSAYFMAGRGLERLENFYSDQGTTVDDQTQPLSKVRPILDTADKTYLEETRVDVEGTSEEHLAFYYSHKPAMEKILRQEKIEELSQVGLCAKSSLHVTSSLRRPFKKGARLPGGTSRSDEIRLRGVSVAATLFLKMMHEIEESILADSKKSPSGLVEWVDTPSEVGELIDTYDFFNFHPFGRINGMRPIQLTDTPAQINGQWKASSVVKISRQVRINPLFSYCAGLYLAEGSTPKKLFFTLFDSKPGPLSLGFTSSEGTSIELMLRVLSSVFSKDKILDSWKVKVGSQYFPELVVIGLKEGVPLMRGGHSGDGKVRTAEISLAIKDWAIEVSNTGVGLRPSLLATEFADRFTHVEMTGAGVARIDFSASSSLCRWYFPLLMYAVFGQLVADPSELLT